MKRRNFLLGSAVFGGSLAASLGVNSLTFAQSRSGRTKTIIKVFQRGGADGLYLFPPTEDRNYFRVRPLVRVEPATGNDPTSAVRLPDPRGNRNSSGQTISLHPQMRALQEIWDDGNLVLAPATHYDNSSRSHFHTQQILEFGGDGESSDGFLNRYLQEVRAIRRSRDGQGFRAVRPGVNTQAPVFNGSETVPVLVDASSFELESPDFCRGTGCADNRLSEKLRSYAEFSGGTDLENHIRRADTEIVETMDITRVAGQFETRANGLEYSNSDLGQGLRLVSQLLKDGQPLEVAALNWSEFGWDSHADQVLENQPINSDNVAYQAGIRAGALDLLTFYRDMRNANMLDDVIVVVGSEFGRTVQQNGSRGTDHGFGSAWFAFGGKTNSGVYNSYRNLSEENLEDGRFVPHITSFQDIIGEAMSKHLGVSDRNLRLIFPKHRFQDNKMFNA